MCHNVLRQENDLTDYGTPICYNDMQPKKIMKVKYQFVKDVKLYL